MCNDDNVIDFENTVKNAIDDGLTGLIRSVAKEAIHRAILQEVNEFVEQYKDLTIGDGKRQVVKNDPPPVFGTPNQPDLTLNTLERSRMR